MDDVGTRGSGLPRLATQSKLPQIRSHRASTLIEPAAPAARTNGIPTATKRNSVVLSPSYNAVTTGATSSSPQKNSAAFSPTRNNRSSILMKPGFKIPSPIISQAQEESIDTLIASPTRQKSRIASPTIDQQAQPSLSDRTVETLSSIPPSPSPSKRRQSGFFVSESPSLPQSRTTSALAYSRPASQMSFSSTRYRDPPSPSKRAPSSYVRNNSIVGPITTKVETPSVTRRAVSGGSAVKSENALGIQQLGKTATSTVLSKPVTGSRISMIGSKPPVSRGIRSPLKDASRDFQQQAPVDVAGLQPTTLAFRRPSVKGQSQITGLRKVKSPVPSTETTSNAIEDRKSANSSQSLRSTIQQARMRMDKKPDNAFTPRAVDQGDFNGLGIDIGAQHMDLQESMHVNVIRKRIHMAKSDGKLNISMLCLSELPTEVLHMYEANDDEGGLAWFEAVDIVRLNAADNELKGLPENVFAIPTSGDEEVAERDVSTGIFGGLQAIDLHENCLSRLPLSLGGLPRLTTINLSRNRLQTTSLEILVRISGLRELRLSQNELTGPLPDNVGDMQSLELLDVHGNTLTDLPSSLGKLSALKHLDISENRITSLPFEAIFDLHLIEMNASRNKLTEVMVPANVSLVPYLQKLNVSKNSLTSLADARLDFPSLQSLDISNNKISALPNMSAWQSLVTLNAEENKISEIPLGFSSLKELVHADFRDNSLLEVDEGIGSMEKLKTLNLSINPIRERRLPKLTTEELKAALKSRANGLPSAGSDRSGRVPQLPTFAQAMAWTVQGDTLDRANSKLKEVERTNLEPLSHEQIHHCIFHHNQLQTIPQSLELLGSTLVSLDLSNNKLSKSSSFLPQSLALPKLQTLNMTLNGLTTLNPLLQNLQAPQLATLIITFNKITTLPANPSLTSAFPALTKLVATNNQIASLDVNSLRGLQVLDVSSNEIEALPPQLALLQGTLRTLMVNGNKFRVPSWGVLEKGTEEVLKWCRRQIPRGQEGAMEPAW